MFDDHKFAGTGCAEACMEATRLGTDKIPQSHIPHLQFTVWELRMRAAGFALGVPTVQPDRLFLKHPARLTIIPEAILRWQSWPCQPEGYYGLQRKRYYRRRTGQTPCVSPSRILADRKMFQREGRICNTGPVGPSGPGSAQCAKLLL